MSFVFATCERHRAIEFLQMMYPNAEILDTSDKMGPLLDLIEHDYLRVTDPHFHRGMLIEGAKIADAPIGYRDIVKACLGSLTYREIQP